MNTIFLGRQPIYDRALEVHAYELLYRSGEANHAGGPVDGDYATSSVILNSLMEIGLEEVVGAKPAFINLTRAFLTGEHPIPFPAQRCVLEVLEDISVDQPLLEAIQRLRGRGFTIALDDFEFHQGHEALVELADIIKIDLMVLDRQALESLVERLRPYRAKLVAEKIETQDEFEFCRDLGFDYFQGYFLCKPKILNAQRLPGDRLAVLQLLSTLQDPQADMSDLEALISRNVALSYKILRYVNSAFLALPRKIETIRQAVIMLGRETIRSLAALMTLSEVQDKPGELIKLSMIRARMCESLARAEGSDTAKYFTVGLLSTLDAMMDAPMSQLLESLPLSEEIEAALLSRDGPAGRALEAVIHYERGEWEHESCTHYTSKTLTEAYLEALRWADTLFREIAG